MKKIIIIPITLFLVLLLVLNIESKMNKNKFSTDVSGAEYKDKFTVVIDAGHGGYDPGTIAVNDEFEKDITLEISKMLGSLLEQENIEVIYTRTSDNVDFAQENNKKDLEYRVSTANNANADLLISIHCNASDNKDSYGFETWTNTNSKQSKQFANYVQSKLEELDYTQNRGIKNGKDSLHVIRESLVPTVLVEIGFIDYMNDYEFISTKEGKQQIAKALAEAVLLTKENR